MSAGKGGARKEFQKFQTEMTFVLEPSEDTEKEKSDDPMWAVDSSLPEEWLFSEE